MKEISKELLSEVFNCKVIKNEKRGACNITDKLNKIGKYQAILFKDLYYHEEENRKVKNMTIDIYELAHKCKEWALSKGCEIVFMADATKIYKNKYEVYNVTNVAPYCLENFFEACEWTLHKIKEETLK